IAEFRLQTSDCRMQIALQTSDCGLQTADSNLKSNLQFNLNSAISNLQFAISGVLKAARRPGSRRVTGTVRNDRRDESPSGSQRLSRRRYWARPSADSGR